MKITEYPTAQFLDEEDVLIKDGTNGTKQIKGSDLVYALFDGIPQMHREIYRGKNLGGTYTSSQKEAISSGTFHDLWIGDYWTINGHKYYIADFDLFYKKGYNDGNRNATHHAVVILEGGADPTPREYGGVKMWYPTSEIRTNGLATSRGYVNAAFPDSVMTHTVEYGVSYISDLIGFQTFDATIELMSDLNIAPNSNATFKGCTPGNGRQFKLFQIDPDLSHYCDSSINYGNWFFTTSADWRIPDEYAVGFRINGDSSGLHKSGSSRIWVYFLLKG